MRPTATVSILALSGWLSAVAAASARVPEGGGCPGLQIELEPNDAAASATPIDLFDPAFALFAGIGGSIGAPGDVDWYSFTAPPGARAWLSVDTGVAGSGGSRDSVIDVFASDGVTLVEADDDDGTGNGRDFSIESQEASLVAGTVLSAGGTYFARVRAKVPGEAIGGYSLLIGVTNFAPQAEVRNNDCAPGAPAPFGLGNALVLSSLSSPTDVDCYDLGVLDIGFPFIVLDGDPERDGITTDLTLNFYKSGGSPSILTDSSAMGSPGNPPAEGFALTQGDMGTVRITGTGAGTYLLAILYSSQGCPVPVELTSFEIE